MIQLAIGSFLLGAVLGGRFNVFVLIPAMLVGFAIVTPSVIVSSENYWHVFEANVVCAVALQAGYLATAIARSVFIAARTGRLSVRSFKIARSA